MNYLHTDYDISHKITFPVALGLLPQTTVLMPPLRRWGLLKNTNISLENLDMAKACYDLHFSNQVQVLHMITDKGYMPAFPSAFSTVRHSTP